MTLHLLLEDSVYDHGIPVRYEGRARSPVMAGTMIKITLLAVSLGAFLLPTDVSPADGDTVAPGKVRWHEDFDAALAAGKRSGKPIFLFQMMGRLDERLC